MNKEQIKEIILKIEENQRDTQDELDKLKEMITEKKPETPEEKANAGKFYQELAKQAADRRELNRLKNS
jgi:hypothetical protein